MALPLYRIGDQILFDFQGGFTVGLVKGVQSFEETWKYLVAYSLVETQSQKQGVFLESSIRGVLFTAFEKTECEERSAMEEAIDLE